MPVEKRNIILAAVLCLVTAGSGCSGVQETAKTIWGSSTRALENARVDAVRKSFQCSAEQGFDTVVTFVNEQLEISQAEAMKEQQSPDPNRVMSDDDDETLTISKIPSLRIFLKDKRRNVIVLMGVPGSTDTTEVGVFLVPQPDGNTQVEISSLSRLAKQKAAEIVFSELQDKFSLVVPPPATEQKAQP